MLLWAMVGVATALAECPADALEQAVATAGTLEVAYSNMDDVGFDTALRQLNELIPCVDQEISPGDAVVIHRARAIGSFVAGDAAASRRSWLAVKALQPDWRPSENLMPVGHPMRKLWEAPLEATAPMVVQEVAPPGGWSVDAVRQNMVPAHRAYILQGFSATGSVAYTGYLYEPGDVPTSLPVGLVPSRRSTAEAPVAKGGGAARVVGTGIAGALLIGSSGGFLMGSSYAERASAAEDDLSTTKYISRSRTASAAGIGLAGGAVVVGVGAWAIKW